MANQFWVKVKLQGFELEMKGTREDVPMIAHNVGQQLAGILAPVAEIVEGEDILESKAASLPSTGNGSGDGGASTRRRNARKRRPSGPVAEEGGTQEETPAWNHDPSKWGIPPQDWSTADKGVWLLYVVSKETEQREMSAPKIAAVFNNRFRQSGKIRAQNITRDFGNLKTKPPALVSDDPTKNPIRWYLTQAGDQKGQELVRLALGQPALTL